MHISKHRVQFSETEHTQIKKQNMTTPQKHSLCSLLVLTTAPPRVNAVLTSNSIA